jgi:hypothetical protein
MTLCKCNHCAITLVIVGLISTFCMILFFVFCSGTCGNATSYLLEVVKLHSTRKTRSTCLDPNPTLSDFLKKVKLIRDQMTFNPIKIYQRSKKTQHVNDPTRLDPDPILPDPIFSIRSN